MKKYLLTLLLLLVCVNKNIFCNQDYISVFNNANSSYEKGDYAEAIDGYEFLLSENQYNKHIFYNLGNAYYKNSQFGKSILNFERAKKLSPSDKDINHNLEFLRTLVGEPKINFPSLITLWLTSILTLNSLLILNSIVFILLIIGIIVVLFTRRQWLKIANIGLILGFIIISGWTLLQINADLFKKYAIIITENASIRNGPGTDNSVAFSLPQGRKVVVINSQGEWTAIEVMHDNLRGWIQSNDFEEI
ncbi:SH3 domain-containing protein [Elusimicrobiota bacterium]